MNETRKLNAQFATVQSAIAGLRRCKGKISEIISQKTGPSPIAKLAMQTISAISARSGTA